MHRHTHPESVERVHELACHLCQSNPQQVSVWRAHVPADGSRNIHCTIPYTARDVRDVFDVFTYDTGVDGGERKHSPRSSTCLRLATLRLALCSIHKLRAADVTTTHDHRPETYTTVHHELALRGRSEDVPALLPR